MTKWPFKICRSKIGIFALFFSINLVFNHCKAQDVISVKYFGLSIHPFGDKTADLQPFKLDKKARFVANIGGLLSYEHFIYRDLISVRFTKGAFTDCSAGFAMIGHLGLRTYLIKSGKHSFSIGMGPAYFLRKSWKRFGDRYESTGYFKDGQTSLFNLGSIQYKIVPLVIELEYDYRLSENDDLSLSFTPGVPLVATLSIGWKHWFNRRSYSPRIYVPRRKR